MFFSEDEKIEIIKACTSIIKQANGRGPKNIYIKYFINEIHIVIEGIISEFEKRIVRNFGQEAIDILTIFYERDSYNAEKHLSSILNNKYDFKFYKLESDFINDFFIYKMKIIE